MASKSYVIFCAVSIYVAATAAREIQNTDITVQESPAAEESLLNKGTTRGETSGNLGKRCFVPTPEGRRVYISIRLNKAEENQKQQNLELALATTKLTELEKISTAENLSPSNRLTIWQRYILNEIARTKARKEDLTVDSAVTNTMVEQLKIILVANGGSINTNSPTNNQNSLNNQIRRAQDSREKINANLVRVTAELEQLQSQTNAQNNANNAAPTTTISQIVLNRIERTKERKYDLTLQLAVTNTLIEQLQLQLNGSTNSSNANTATNGSTNSPNANTATNGSTNSPNANTAPNGSTNSPNANTAANGSTNSPNANTPTNGSTNP